MLFYPVISTGGTRHTKQMNIAILHIFLLQYAASISGQATTKTFVRERIQVLQPPAQEFAQEEMRYRMRDSISKFLQPNVNQDQGATTYPVQVDAHGRFITNNVKFSYPKFKSRSRKKRSISEDDHIYFKMMIENKEMLLNLSRNHNLVHSNFIVERLRDDTSNAKMDSGMKNKFDSAPRRSSIKLGNGRQCYFRGHVTGHPNSQVAISTCNGLTGFVRLNNTAEYLIEPTAIHSLSKNSRMPHRLYKRGAERRPAADLLRARRTDEANVRSSYTRSGFPNNHQDFCGVADTKSQYKRDLRARQKWEDRRIKRNPFQRSRRSISLEHWIELMLVVDNKMVHYHGKNIESYVLTIVNMVSELFHDVSIGNSLHVTLIRLVLLEGDEKGLKITQHAERTLDSFCRWAKRMNPKSDNHANHHDVAVLLTRRNICSRSNKSCETLGLAHVAGMCQSHRSCNVNQDTGLSLAFTVAHELGHNFAMHHDGQLNHCTPDEANPRVMTPHLTSNNLPMRWSTCSRKYITRFLDRNWGFCLMDTPSSELTPFPYPSELPGVLYDADHQCRLMFGAKSRHCKGLDDMCNRLWCLYRGTCRSRLHSAVQGTKCGRGRWCYGGKCVRVGKRAAAFDGAWSAWTTWSRCSRSCGVGITFSERRCDQPEPRHGGRYCLGERKRYRTCNKWACEATNTTSTFREQQCADFNNVLYKNKTYTWLPVNSAVYPCELHCYTRAGKTPFADRLRDKVIDGTKCYNRGKDICVDGICKSLGCDLMIDSPAQEDRCGVCRGDGTSCEPVDNIFDVKRGEQYVQVGILPKGARNIEVSEVRPSRNFLALKGPGDSDKFYLNGGYMIQWNSNFELAGSTFSYERVNTTQDNITAQGPITHDIMIMILFVEENPGIRVSYMMPFNVTAVFEEERPKFEWMMQKWSSCSRTCGRGIQLSLAICVERKAGFVEEDFCDLNTRPDDNRRFCNTSACPPEWLTGPWQSCSVTCGGQRSGRQSRNVLCIQSISDDEQVVLDSSRCVESAKPISIRKCPPDAQQPCPVWRTGPWSNCTKPCNRGHRSRSVLCVTYIRNDVTSVPNDISSIEEDLIEVDELDGQHFDIALAMAARTAEVTVNKVKIRKRPKQKNFVENYDFDINDDDLCYHDDRPTSTQRCNLFPCPSLNSVFDLSPAGLLSSNNSAFDPLMLIRTNSHRQRTVDLDGNDFDVEVRPNQVQPPQTPIHPTNSTYDVLDQLSGSGETPTTELNNFTISMDTYSNTTFDISGSGSSDIEMSGTTYSTHTLEVTSVNTTNVYVSTLPEPTASTVQAKWLTGVWGQCSTSCGMGAQIRTVVCSSGGEDCNDLPMPAPAQRCNVRRCAMWVQGEWSKCSQSCGVGTKHRKPQCRDAQSSELLRPYHCNSVPRLPLVNKTCDMNRCLPWKTSRWTSCNVTCGPGYQRRRTACSRPGMCDPRQKPVQLKACMLKVCVEWRTLEWERCSVNCGNGLRHRRVVCVEKESSIPNDTCNVKLKPRTHKKCYKGPCRVTDFDFTSCLGDRLKTHFCAVLKQWGKCVQPSLAIQCCSTCHTFTSLRTKGRQSAQ
ncbi:A disintegrin and metalloproteinase with thrombospondin motifs 12-like [Ciona intestinalis]